MVEVNVHDQRAILSSRSIEKIFRKVYRYLHVSFPKRSISIVWVSARRIQSLNYEYRRRNNPTNILSFSYQTTKGAREGELVLCAGVIRKEASTFHLKIRDYTIRLLLHGLLHIEGYEHGSHKKREIMEQTERRMLRELGINPEVFF